jgi:tetratricopeptide (TPR) repeat protein
MRRQVFAACSWMTWCALTGQPTGYGQQPPAGAEAGATTEADAATGKTWQAKAMEYAARVRDQEMRNHVYLQAAHVLARSGDLASAEYAAKQIANPQTRVYAHSAVAKQHVARGDQAAALRVLTDCERSFAGADVKDLQEGSNYLVDAYAAFGFEREANAVGKHTRWPQFTDDDIARKAVQRGDVIHGLDKADGGTKLSLAAQVIEFDKNPEHVAHALTAARSVSGAKNLDHGFASVARSLTKVKRLAEARELAARIIDPLQQARALGNIAAAEARGETPEAIRARIESADLLEEKAPLYKLLVARLLEADQMADAESVVEELVEAVAETPRPDEMSKFGNMTSSGRTALAKTLHAEIAAAYFKRGMHDDYERQVQLAVDAVAGMDTMTGIAKTMALMQVLSVQLHADDVAGARETIAKARIASGEGPDGEPLSSFTLSSMAGKVAEKLIDKGEIAEGLAVAKDIHGRMVGGAFGDVANALIRAGRIEDAKSQMQRLIAEGDAALATMTVEETKSDLFYHRRAIDSNRVRAFQDVGAALAAAGRDAELDAWLPQMPDDAMRAAACLGASDPREN